MTTDRAGDESELTSERGIRAEAWPFVRDALVFDVVESTNDCAAEYVRDPAAKLPLLVWARGQTRGRGRGENRWWSDAGSLTFTLAIDPRAHGLAVASEPKLALAAAVAAIGALDDERLGQSSLGIRWPNDLEADGGKLGGILPERVETGHGLRLLIGIGINVSTCLANAPADIQAMATTLEALHTRVVSHDTLGQLLVSVLRHFESVLGRLIANDVTLFERWNRLDRLRGQRIRVDQGTQIIEGVGRGIDEDGALCLDVGAAVVRILGGRVLR